MQAKQVHGIDILNLIKHCYESDVDHICRVHTVGDEGIKNCINRTVVDLAVNDVKVFEIWNNDKFIGYFGDNSGTLTGFFLMPEYRKVYKKEFWNIIVNHFNGSFQIGIWDKNQPAKNFLEKNECKLLRTEGSGMIFVYKENE